MNIPEPLSIATEIDRAAAALGWSLVRDDWWGPARLAFDTQISLLRDRAEQLANEARTIP